MAADWMLYGANGFTGQLAAREAVRKGHRPLLAGRSREKVRALAEELDLPHTSFDLSDAAAVRQSVRGMRAVLHCAGPFVHTGDPVMRACLAEGAHYLDITGEIPVFQKAFSFHGEAVKAGVALLPGVGFDVIPTDCMARYVASRLPSANRLELAFAAVASPSPGTARSMVEMLPTGTMIRRQGQLVSVAPCEGARMVPFSDRERHCIPVAWGDLETAVHTTGLKDITAYMAFPRVLSRVMRWTGPLMQSMFRFDPLRNVAAAIAHFLMTGPGAREQAHGRSYVYACASNEREKKEAWLETTEAYAFTAKSSVLSLERTIASGLRGYFTPALAFGEDFILQIEGSIRSEQTDMPAK